MLVRSADILSKVRSCRSIPSKSNILFKSLTSFLNQAAQRLVRRLPLPKRFWVQADLLRVLVQRSLEERYKGSMIGNLWPLVNQLSQLLVYTFLFSFVLGLKLNGLGRLPDNRLTFGLWLFAGLIPWIAFTTGFSQAAMAVVAQPNLVKKVVFPLSLLPLVPILAAFLESLTGWMLLLVFVVFSAKVLHTTLLLMPLVWLPQLLFTMGLGYSAAALTVFLRDIPQTIGIVLNLLFYLTPIVYQPDFLLNKLPEAYHLWVFLLNPLTIIVELYRDLILKGEVLHLLEWAWLWLISLACFSGGLWIYRRLRPAFADVL